MVRSADSGPWSAPATWEGGKVPAAGVKVQIREGHTVTYDVKSDQVIRSLHVAGTLTFAPDRDTRLDGGLIKIQAGDDASEDGFDCDAHVADADAGQAAAGAGGRHAGAARSTPSTRPLIRLHLRRGHGQGVVPGHRLLRRPDGLPRRAAEPHLGQARRDGQEGRRRRCTLAEAGHRLARRRPRHRHRHQSRQRRHAASKDDSSAHRRTHRSRRSTAATLTLDKPLEHEHLGDGDYRGEVANLSRNVVVESADPNGVRGHTMYHRGSAGSISYAEFRHLGKEGVLGRYSLHFHLCGDTMRGSSVIGASIWDSHNRWLTIHGTNYLVVRDCVGYQSVGHGFFLEDGTEVYNVLDRNLAVAGLRRQAAAQAGAAVRRQRRGRLLVGQQPQHLHAQRRLRERPLRLPLRGHADAAASSSTLPVLQPDGSTQAVDIRTLPFVRFEDNEAHCDGPVRLQPRRRRRPRRPGRAAPVHHPQHEDLGRRTTPSARRSPSLLVENMHIHQRGLRRLSPQLRQPRLPQPDDQRDEHRAVQPRPRRPQRAVRRR